MVAADAQRFPISFSGVGRSMWLLGIRRAQCFVELTSDRLRVHLAWGFRLDAPLSSVRQAEHDHRRVWAWGAHGWRGRWLVNGSSRGIVRVHLDPDAQARCLVPVRVRDLRVSVDDPDGLIAALDRPVVPHVTN